MHDEGGATAVMAISPIEHYVTSRDLIVDLAQRAPLDGANVGLWQRFSGYACEG